MHSSNLPEPEWQTLHPGNGRAAHETVPVPVVVQQLGLFRFKGAPEPIEMVQLVQEHLAGRRCVASARPALHAPNAAYEAELRQLDGCYTASLQFVKGYLFIKYCRCTVRCAMPFRCAAASCSAGSAQEHRIFIASCESMVLMM